VPAAAPALVRAAVEAARAVQGRAVVLDLCCGSGALGAALAAELGPGAAVFASDLDPAAVACADSASLTAVTPALSAVWKFGWNAATMATMITMARMIHSTDTTPRSLRTGANHRSKM